MQQPAITKHAQTRMNQRAIKRSLIQIAMEYGDHSGDKYVLGCDRIDETIAEYRYKLKSLEEARKKGGLTVVASNNTIVTTYPNYQAAA